MVRWSFGLVGTLCAGLACASIDTESQAPAAPAAPRPAMFAPTSAPFAKRLTPEQRDEWRFLKDAAASSRFEYDASKLALSRSTDERVRSLAAALVNHHAATQVRLARMLGARHMAPPMQSNEQRKALNRLAKLNGAKFDREWIESVGLRSQNESVAVYEKAAQSVRDPALRSWIEQVLPTMRWQVQLAERVTGAGTGTKYARITHSPQVVIKAPDTNAAPAATRYMGAAPADLGEGNMVLGPAPPTAPNTR